jgi:hypothetical protein
VGRGRTGGIREKGRGRGPWMAEGKRPTYVFDLVLVFRSTAQNQSNSPKPKNGQVHCHCHRHCPVTPLSRLVTSPWGPGHRHTLLPHVRSNLFYSPFTTFSFPGRARVALPPLHNPPLHPPVHPPQAKVTVISLLGCAATHPIKDTSFLSASQASPALCALAHFWPD